MQDLIIKSSVAGAVSFLYKQVANHLLYYLGITPFLYRAEAATLVLPMSRVHTYYGVFIGLFADLVVMLWFTLLIGLVLRATGRDYSLLKGAFVGASSWVIVYGLFTHIGDLQLYSPTGFASGLTTIFFDITMGMVASAVYVYLTGKESLVD